MRECTASKMLTLAGLFLSLLFLAGCRSTSLSPLARDSAADSKDALGSQINFKKANAPSAAASSDTWNNAGKPATGVHATGFQEPNAPANEQPIPEIFVKNADDPLPVRLQAPTQQAPTQQAGFRHGGRAQANVPVVIAPPNAPTEGNPVLLPEYMIRPPDVLLIESQKGLLTQPVRGQHLVRPDGTVGLGIYGPASVAGRTIMQAREEIAKSIHSKMAKPEKDDKKKDEKDDKKKDEKEVGIGPPTEADVLAGLSVDVLAYNSSVYYIITDGAGLGQQVYRFPATGNETVLDAIANISGLPAVSSQKRIWVARRNNTGMAMHDSILPVDWKGVTQDGAMNTNWQVMPGDRIFVQADPMRRFNVNLSKFLEPVERLLGVTLLGGQAVNVIRNGNNNTNNNNNTIR